MNGRLKKVISFTVILGLCFTLFAAFATTKTYAASKTHLKKTSITMIMGETYQQKLLSANGKTIAASKVKWSSSNDKVAKVSKKGKVTAVKKGIAKIKAKYKGKVYTCKVKVVGCKIGKKYNEMCVTGGTQEIWLYGADKIIDPKKVKWETNNEEVLKINSKGIVTGISSGTATVYATYCGKRYSDVMVVYNAVLHDLGMKLYDKSTCCYFRTNSVNYVKTEVISGNDKVESISGIVGENGEYYIVVFRAPNASGQVKVKVSLKNAPELYVIYTFNFGGKGEETTSKPPTYANVGIPSFGLLTGLPTIFEGEVEDSMAYVYVYECNEVDIVAKTLCASYRDYLIDSYGWKFFKTESTDDGGIAYALYNSKYTLGIFCNPQEGGQRISVMIMNR